MNLRHTVVERLLKRTGYQLLAETGAELPAAIPNGLSVTQLKESLL
ncbi:MAG: hypothetical protein ACREEM_25315 [Blastocatellia bacterium]